MLCSIIIVNFNGGELLTECVRDALGSNLAVEVIVSDNGSHDGSIMYLRKKVHDERLTIIEHGSNLGFANANNRVLARANGEYILFLNPDCLIQTNTIEKTLKSIQFYNNNNKQKVGMAGCLIRNLDETEQPGCRRRVPTPWRTFVRVLHLDKLAFLSEHFRHVTLNHEPLPKQAITIEGISGAFMLVSRAGLEDVGSMDEGYFLHCEDLDWCMRFRKKGWEILFIPNIEVIHAKGVCSDSRPVRVEWHKHKGMVRFYRKFFRHQYPLALMWIVIVAVWLRFIAIAMFMSVRRLSS
ncbi:MAG: glycosyltransferase family 2 protein [Mariprofundales bacterium]